MLMTTLAGCAVGPDFLRPQAPKDADYAPTPLPQVTDTAAVHGGEAQHFAIGRDIQFDWWTLFRSPALDSLVAKAIKANPTIEAAQAALRQAQENVYSQQGFFFPNVSAGYNWSYNQLAGNNGSNSPGIQSNGRVLATKSNPSGPRYNGPAVFSFNTAQLSVGFVPDVFGANRRAVESQKAQAEFQRFELEATYITLASNVVSAALQEASTRAQIDAVKEIITVNETSLRILRDQFRLGYVMRIDVAAQEAALAAAEALLPPLERQYEQTRDLIRALVGNLPNEDVSETFDLASIQMPQEPPVSLPSKLIDQRPDIRAAEALLHAASAQVGMAVAAMMPQITISGDVGGTGEVINTIFSPGGPFYNIIANATQTLFDGFTLLHQKRAADQALIQAAAQYRSTVITAYQNVADTLHALVSDAKALRTALAAEHAAKVTLDLTQSQHDIGYVDYLTLLNAEQAYEQALLSLVQAQVTRYGDTAALYQALGGGWWNRAKLPSAGAAAFPAKPD